MENLTDQVTANELSIIKSMHRDFTHILELDIYLLILNKQGNLCTV